jgi:hypothetical protein
LPITVSSSAPAIYGGVGADFHVIADQHTTDLRNLHPARVSLAGETEAVGTDHRTGMQHAAITDDTARVKRHPRMQPRGRADHAIIAHHGTRADHGRCTDAYACTDDRACCNVGGRVDDCVGGDHRTRLDAWNKIGSGLSSCATRAK